MTYVIAAIVGGIVAFVGLIGYVAFRVTSPVPPMFEGDGDDE